MEYVMAKLLSASKTSKPHRTLPMEGIRFIQLSRKAPAAPSFMPRPAALGQPAGLAVQCLRPDALQRPRVP
ncbi:hypothetical protein V8C44DRAFT_341589 [Trichoderma aethiopicum]